METSHEYDMAVLTVRNHGEAYEYLRNGRLFDALNSLFQVVTRHHKDISRMERQRAIIETLAYWQRTLDDPNCDE